MSSGTGNEKGKEEASEENVRSSYDNAMSVLSRRVSHVTIIEPKQESESEEDEAESTTASEDEEDAGD